MTEPVTAIERAGLHRQPAGPGRQHECGEVADILSCADAVGDLVAALFSAESSSPGRSLASIPSVGSSADAMQSSRML